MQTILGSGGAIGKELAKALTAYTKDIRLVSRNPQKVNDTDITLSADLTSREDVDKAVAGSSVVYVTVGFKYHLNTWRKNWPRFMQNLIDACKKHKAKVVFFDNIYMYDQSEIPHMTEEAKIKPPSKKGQVRGIIANMLMAEVEAGNLEALIARSADFYGPGIKNTSMLTETVFSNLASGKKAFWMGPLNFKHSFTYTPDAAMATAMLGNSKDAFNQIWHLPTAAHPVTGQEWVDQIAEALGKPPKVQVMTRFFVKLLGIFIPVMREMPEMMYQYDSEYVFDSSKFEKAFDFKPTSYKEGIKKIVEEDYS
jgi:nucleoside-diphosphate-sugar epimerase